MPAAAKAVLIAVLLLGNFHSRNGKRGRVQNLSVPCSSKLLPLGTGHMIPSLRISILLSERDPMLWAAVCMCFFRFLRAGEVVVPLASNYDPTVHLSHEDVQAENTASPQYLEIRIKASKTEASCLHG